MDFQTIIFKVLKRMAETGESAKRKQAASVEDEDFHALITEAQYQTAQGKGEEGALDTMDILEDQLIVRKGLLNKFKFLLVSENKRRASRDFVHPHPAVYEFVNKTKFELWIGFVMILNGYFMAESASRPSTEPEPFYSFILEHIFVAIFVCEAVLRIMAFGWPWMFEFYNACDLFLIFVTGVLVMWLLPVRLRQLFKFID
jgi:hypothetical protein